jgi:hypothetical protein
MKGPTLEQEITASRPENFEVNNVFVDRTMRQVLNIASYTPIKEQNVPKISLFKRFSLLPIPLMIAIVVFGLCITSGAAYAALKYVPNLLNITSKTTSQRGTTEYAIANFEQCQADGLQKVDRFELKKSATTQTNEEIIKILQAKCELGIIDKFVKDKWPTLQVSNKSGKNFSTYARADVIAQYSSKSNNKLVYVFNGKAERKTPPRDTKLRAFDQGKEVSFKDIRKGSTVFVITEVKESRETKTGSNPSTEVIGVLGIVRLSLPAEYYYEKQNLLTEVTRCIGNETARCPSTASIDVFPREPNSEGASNPYFKNQDGVYREISGEIQKLDTSNMTLRASSGAQYVISLPNGAFKRYNTEFAKNYTDVDASLKIGSNISIRYTQPANADPKQITPEQVQAVSLLIDMLDKKDGYVKQY